MLPGGIFLLFRESAASLADRTHLEGRLAELLTENFLHKHRHRPQPAEVRSWERSIPALTNALVEAGLGEVEMLLEYGLPLTSKRADVILAGVHPATGGASYVVVELKQWSEAYPEDDDPLRCRIPAYPAPVLNPIEQVRGYCDYLVSFNGALERIPESIAGVAYLHNATEFGVAGLRAVSEDHRGRMFTGDQRGAFLGYLRSRLAAKPGAEAADALLQGKARPSRQLMTVAAEEVRNREQFVLLDEQRLAYETVMSAVRQARRSNRKQVVVVAGGPGSGKSVIALSLLGDLYRRGVPALHATGSQSFTKTMRKVAGARKPEVQRLFRYFNSFMEAEPNDLDVLVCDEAHRLRKTSANRYTKAALRTGRPQVAELMDAARVPVFLLDQHQVVRPGEMGTVEQIQAAAAEQDLDCTVVRLDSQFRCGGSDAYLRWVVDLLGLEGNAPTVWEPDDKVRLLTADSPQELEDLLAARRAQGYGARMSAGYCWKWTTKITSRMHSLPSDVVIGDWARPWNLYGDRALLGAPPAPLWATDPAGFGQIGCVYTAQGFEYDWSGVIMGPDLVWRTDRWVVDRSASKDPSFTKATPDEDVDRLVRNTYKVLLTRGMIGTIVYSTDPETREKLRSLIPPAL
ncbi:ATP-binding protein [Streptomyces nigrescens]|uniref:ATP-binding protein n=1 Tax=Streptomyces nigrescens TaxID=1920 RepID=A0A640TCS6_STRNI|nr:ATP-binding protein [Streptomyces libani subsp. libani]GGW01869.1 ATP-binding protein [Streptomyces libani subsp. libani]